jgi:hypothetical protein
VLAVLGATAFCAAAPPKKKNTPMRLCIQYVLGEALPAGKFQVPSPGTKAEI